jgi:nucleoside 2-deoxyribosyltransferase
MKTCFVIQRFDGAVYDKRYRETFAPAIEQGGAKAIRADEVLGTRPVVEKIEAGLRSSDIAFAEISEDNPNVFLELGYALALNVPTVIVCDRAKRQRLPFDIAHRPINFYSTDALSDYENISREVRVAVSAALLESETRQTVEPIAVPGVLGEAQIDDVKSACLIALLDQTLRAPMGTTLWQIQKEVSGIGLTERMVALAIASLAAEGLIEKFDNTDQNDEPYCTFALTDLGSKYLLRSYSSLMQQERDRTAPQQRFTLRGTPDGLDDDVPF